MPAFESFRAARWLRTVNLLLQAVLIVTLCLGLNYLASRHVWRKDLTQSRRYSLSPLTRAYLEKLSQPVRVVVTLTEPLDGSAPSPLADVRGLLREYQHTAAANLDAARQRDGRISIEYLDVDRQVTEATALRIPRDVVMFRSGENRRDVTAAELYRQAPGPDGAPRLEFLGEQAFTSALLEVSNFEKEKIYFLAGNEQLRIEDVDRARGLSAFANELRNLNFAVESLELREGQPVPEDAALVVVPGPRRILPAVQEQLRQYLNRPNPGRMFIMLRQEEAAHGLSALLQEWGVLDYTNLVIDPPEMTENGDLRVYSVHPSHPITQPVRNVGGLVVGPSRSLFALAGSMTGGVRAIPLTATTERAWGEKSFRSAGTPLAYDPADDQKGLPNIEPKGALTIAIASERARPATNLAFSVPSGRVVVVGTVDLATNERMVARQGNRTFAISAVNWAVGREPQLNVPARPVERFQLSLSQQELGRLRFSLLFVVPGAVAVLGLLVYWTRRK